MTCTGCQAKVRSLLSKVEGVKNVEIDLAKEEVTIDMKHHISTEELKNSLAAYPKYELTENGYGGHKIKPVVRDDEEERTWFQTYKPVNLIFCYIIITTLLLEAVSGQFELFRWLEHFMAGFFLIFSFFKLLNLKAFADSYAIYDIVAKNWKAWGFIYPFIELGLGLAFLIGFSPLITNSVTFLVMSVSLIGVLQSVLNKRKIKCACLGDVFNLPMSTITIIEDGLMIAMSIFMLAILR